MYCDIFDIDTKIFEAVPHLRKKHMVLIYIGFSELYNSTEKETRPSEIKRYKEENEGKAK